MRQELRQADCAVAGWAEHLRAMHAERRGPYKLGSGPIQRSLPLGSSGWPRSTFSMAPAVTAAGSPGDELLADQASGARVHRVDIGQARSRSPKGRDEPPA